MKRFAAAIVVSAAAGCDLDLFGAYTEYCVEHPGACDGGLGGQGGAGGGGTGGGAAGGVDDGGSGIDSWCERVSAATCARRERCLEPAFRWCSTLASPDCAQEQRPAVKRGLLTYDRVVAGACLAQLDSLACEEPVVGCAGVFKPAAGLGDRCSTVSVACVDGHYCSGASRFTANGACPTCLAHRRLGDSCDGGTCDPRTGYCDPGTLLCVRLLDAGEPCTSVESCELGCRVWPDGGQRCGPFPIGSRCEQHQVCQPGGYCSGLLIKAGDQLLDAGTCAPAPAFGQSCELTTFDVACGEGACLNGVCSRPQRTGGSACTRDGDCDSNRCDRVYFDLNGVPVSQQGSCHTRGDAGAPCEADEMCLRGLHCAADGGCSQPLAVGADCVSHAQCGGNACRQTDAGNRCEAPAPPDTACGPMTCGPPFQCRSVDGGMPMCLRRANGEPCMGPPFCESFHCDRSDGGGAVCADNCFL